MTYTIVLMEVSRETYNEIEAKLRKANYGHAFGEDGVIDMSGIGVASTEQQWPEHNECMEYARMLRSEVELTQDQRNEISFLLQGMANLGKKHELLVRQHVEDSVKKLADKMSHLVIDPSTIVEKDNPAPGDRAKEERSGHHGLLKEPEFEYIEPPEEDGL